jgi:hypothetical protein
MTSKQPPRVATWMLKHFGSGPDNDALLGDLAEQYLKKDSAMWYWRQTMKAIPVSFFREIRAHRRIAARALLTGWGLWIFSLLWFFPFVSPYFFGNGVSAAFSTGSLIGSTASVMWMPVGAPMSINQGALRDVWPFVFGIVLPLIVAAICGWLVARFHRGHQRAVVLLFAGSILLMDLLFFGHFVFTVGSGPAYAFAGPLAFYVAASVGGILLGGGLLRGPADTLFLSARMK